MCNSGAGTGELRSVHRRGITTVLGLSARGKPWIFAIVIVLCGVGVDAGSKLAARHMLLNQRFFNRQHDYLTCNGTSVELRRQLFVENNSKKILVIPGFFQFRYVENCGSSFRIMDNVAEGIRLPFILTVTIFACMAIPFVYLRTRPSHRLMLFSLPLVLAGALGNLIDRVYYRYVVDFIDWFVVFRGKAYHWPTFNIADTLILAGLLLMVLQLTRDKENHNE
jgi:signal peptidase II